jgi:hypothetical protein
VEIEGSGQIEQLNGNHVLQKTGSRLVAQPRPTFIYNGELSIEIALQLPSSYRGLVLQKTGYSVTYEAGTLRFFLLTTYHVELSLGAEIGERFSYVAMTYSVSRGTMKLYVNGALEDSMAVSSYITDEESDLVIDSPNLAYLHIQNRALLDVELENPRPCKFAAI